jgi:hypothetical protein
MMNMSRSRAKVSLPLAARMRSAQPEDMLVVILELDRPSDRVPPFEDRQRQIQHLKRVFETEAEPVEAAIENAGGQVLDRAWINHTMRALVPAGSLASLSTLDNVETLDLPRFIERD